MEIKNMDSLWEVADKSSKMTCLKLYNDRVKIKILIPCFKIQCSFHHTILYQTEWNFNLSQANVPSEMLR